MIHRARRLVREAGRTLAACVVALCLSVPATAAITTITRDAWLQYIDPLNGLQTEVWSNMVLTEVTATPAAIRFFTDRSFARRAMATGVGATLFIQADASACNADPLARDTATVLVRSAATGLSQSVTVTETAPNSGVFRSGASGTTGAPAP